MTEYKTNSDVPFVIGLRNIGAKMEGYIRYNNVDYPLPNTTANRNGSYTINGVTGSVLGWWTTNNILLDLNNDGITSITLRPEETIRTYLNNPRRATLESGGLSVPVAPATPSPAASTESQQSFQSDPNFSTLPKGNGPIATISSASVGNSAGHFKIEINSTSLPSGVSPNTVNDTTGVGGSTQVVGQKPAALIGVGSGRHLQLHEASRGRAPSALNYETSIFSSEPGAAFEMKRKPGASGSTSYIYSIDHVLAPQPAARPGESAARALGQDTSSLTVRSGAYPPGVGVRFTDQNTNTTYRVNMPLSEDMLNHVLRGGKLFLHQKPDGATYWGNETGAAFTPTVAAASTAATVTTVKQAELGFTNLRSTGATGNRSNEPGFKAGAEIATAVKDGGLLVVTEDNMLRSVSLDRNGTIQMRDIPLQAKNLQDFQAAVDVTDSTQVGKVSKDKKGVILGHSVASAQPYPRTGPIMDVAPGDKKVTLTQEGQFAVVTTSGNNGKIIQAEVLNNSLDKHAFELMKGDPRKLDDAQKKEIAGYIKRLEQESGLKLTAPATQAAGAAPPQNAPPPRVEYKKYGPNGIVVFPAPPQPPAPAAPQPSAPPSRRPPPPAPEKSGEIRAETPTGSVTVSLAEAAPHGAAAGAKPDQVAVAKAAGGSTPSAASDTTPT